MNWLLGLCMSRAKKTKNKTLDHHLIYIPHNATQTLNAVQPKEHEAQSEINLMTSPVIHQACVQKES